MFRSYLRYVNNVKYSQYKSFYQAHKAYQFKNNRMSILKPSEINDRAYKKFENKMNIGNNNDKNIENNKMRKEKESVTISSFERGTHQINIGLKREYEQTRDDCNIERKHFKGRKEEDKKISQRFGILMKEVERMFLNYNFN